MGIKNFLILALLIFFASAAFADDVNLSSEAANPQSAKIQFDEKNSLEDYSSKYSLDINKTDYSTFLTDSKQFFLDNKNNPYTTIEQLKSFYEAKEKFSQSNVSSAYKTFNSTVVADGLNDFQYMLMAYQLSDLGLFGLADISVTKVQNTKIWQSYIDEIRKIYFPKNKLSYDDEIFLANIYASINYNNLTRESISDLMKKDKILKKSDYANYLLAQAFFKEKDFPKALSAINKALAGNSNNIYYNKLKIQTLCEQKKYKEALKLANDLNAMNIKLPDLQNDIEKINYYVISKCEKNELKSKYYLAYYIYLNQDYERAVNELLPLVAKNKLPQAQELLALAYLKSNNLAKANEEYKKIIKNNKKNSNAYKGIANINFIETNYEESVKNYLSAYKYNKKDYDLLLNISLTQKYLNNQKEAESFLNKAANINDNSYKYYYLKALIEKDKKEYYLDKSLELNPFYLNTWFNYTETLLSKKEPQKAMAYLDCVKFIEENSHRYYYYKGLIAKINNDDANLEKNIKTSIMLYNIKKGANLIYDENGELRDF